MKGSDGMITPTTIQNDFTNDYFLECPNCKEPIIFPLIRNPAHIHDKRPNKCRICGELFNWEEYDRIKKRGENT